MKTLTPEQKDHIDAQVEDCTAEIIFEKIYGKKLTDEWYGTYEWLDDALTKIMKEHYNNPLAAELAGFVQDEEAAEFLEKLGFEIITYPNIRKHFIFKMSGDPIPTRY